MVKKAKRRKVKDVPVLTRKAVGYEYFDFIVPNLTAKAKAAFIKKVAKKITAETKKRTVRQFRVAWEYIVE